MTTQNNGYMPKYYRHYTMQPYKRNEEKQGAREEVEDGLAMILNEQEERQKCQKMKHTTVLT